MNSEHINKSLITNLASILLIILGFLSPWGGGQLLHTGLFAFSGAITNWLAIHMLFERVPFLYGSGVIPNQFEAFRSSIRDMIMEQFFTSDNIKRFITEKLKQQSEIFDFRPVIDKLDYNKLFDKLLEAIQESSFGGMLGMIGGVTALDPLRQPFTDKIKRYLNDFLASADFHESINSTIFEGGFRSEMHNDIEEIVSRRLLELTPEMVKDITQRMIRKHLGWLVVWGGVFGGLIGLIVSILV